jgi:hypothetical protein
MINRRARPTFVLNFGQRRAVRFDERPVRFPFRALRDPASQQINLRVGEMLAGLEWRHAIILVRRRDPLDQRALRPSPGTMAKLSDLGFAARLPRYRSAVRPCACLSRVVTGVAVV